MSLPPCLPSSLAEQALLLQEAGLLDPDWYRARYPDVALLGMDPARHYLLYGAAMGRDPGPVFDTAFYLSEHPLLARYGINPALHYARHGRFKGYARQRPDAAARGRQKVALLRYKLLSLGFTDRPLAALARIAEEDETAVVRAQAARELAMWHMRAGTPEGYGAALGALRRAPATPGDATLRCRLLTLELLCRHFLGQRAEALALWAHAEARGHADADAMLARANLAPTPEARLDRINQVLARFDIPALRLSGPEGATPYDRLCPVSEPVPVPDGPKVSVLIAAYKAAATLPTALDALARQSWRNLEILVIDDASPDGGATLAAARDRAAHDARIKVIALARNGGAYVARNRGLDAATGEFVTLHDADDWSHPLKIERQMRHLLAHPDILGCTSDQARATAELEFHRWSSEGQMITGNTSSFLFRRAPVRRDFGYWDSVRFSADTELIRRIRHRHGSRAVTEMQTGPLSFQRDSESSIVADPALGIAGFLFGVRKAYFETQAHHRDTGGTLKFGSDPEVRAFPAPRIMQADRSPHGRFRAVLACDPRLRDDALRACLDDAAALRDAGQPVALVQMLHADLGPLDARPPRPEVLDAMARTGLPQLCYGEAASCDHLVIHDADLGATPQRYLPDIVTDRLSVVARRRGPVAPAGLGRALQARFGSRPRWFPANALVRAMLEPGWDTAAGELMPVDWPALCHAAAPLPQAPEGPEGTPVIGRHTPDREGAWPAEPGALLAAYPGGGPVAVEVLGAAEVPAAMLGALPDGWTVHGDGALSVTGFMARLNAFVHLDAVPQTEEVPGAVLEAMAAGIPAILSPHYAPLFGDLALYAAPFEVVDRLAALRADPPARRALVARAVRVATERFGAKAHRAGLAGLGLLD